MSIETFPYFIPYLVSLGLSLGVAVTAWRRRAVPGASTYAIFAAGSSIWIFGYIFELASITVAGKGFWDDFQWLGLIITAITFPLFAIEFTHTNPQSEENKVNRNRMILAIVPFIIFLLVLTNPYHGMIRGESWLIYASPFPVLMYEFTSVIWFISLYYYAVFIWGIVFLVRHYFDSPPDYRIQVGLIGIGVVIPMAGSLMTLTGVSLSSQRDIFPITLAIGNVFVGLGLWRFNMFNLVPIARNTVFDTMGDLVVVLDPKNRVIDINLAALQLSNFPEGNAIGKHIGNVYPELRSLIDENSVTESGKFELRERENYFDVVVKPIYDYHGRFLARVFVAHNVSAHKKLEEKLRQLNNELEERVTFRTRELAESYDTTLEGWAKALELRDQETEGHSRRVTEMTVRLASSMGVNGAKLEHIRRGALLHDIGKMGVPDKILRKPARLTEDEFDVVKLHPIIARELLAPIPFLQPALNIPYCHHEWWNGQGYPQGLMKENIPLDARIFAVIDHWDALRSDRPYRDAWPHQEVVDYLKENAGTIFDPGVVEAFLVLVESGEIEDLREVE